MTADVCWNRYLCGQLFPKSPTKSTEISYGTELNRNTIPIHLWSTPVQSHARTPSSGPDPVLFAWDSEQRLDIKVICAQPESWKTDGLIQRTLKQEPEIDEEGNVTQVSCQMSHSFLHTVLSLY